MPANPANPARLLDDLHKQKIKETNPHHQVQSDSEDELIDVSSTITTPALSANVTRSSSPLPGAKRGPGPSGLRVAQSADDALPGKMASLSVSNRPASRDPLKALPDKVRPWIFCLLAPKDLANCSLVSQRWKRSQTVNHAWYQLYRRDLDYQGSDLPLGRWTKRESKKDWRAEYMNTRRVRQKEESSAPLFSYSRPTTRPHTPSGQRADTPSNRGMREEQWKEQEELRQKPSKNEMRDVYKDLGGRKAKGKSKTGMMGGMRDRTAYVEQEGWFGE